MKTAITCFNTLKNSIEKFTLKNSFSTIIGQFEEILININIAKLAKDDIGQLKLKLLSCGYFQVSIS